MARRQRKPLISTKPPGERDNGGGEKRLWQVYMEQRPDPTCQCKKNGRTCGNKVFAYMRVDLGSMAKTIFKGFICKGCHAEKLPGWKDQVEQARKDQISVMIKQGSW